MDFVSDDFQRLEPHSNSEWTGTKKKQTCISWLHELWRADPTAQMLPSCLIFNYALQCRPIIYFIFFFSNMLNWKLNRCGPNLSRSGQVILLLKKSATHSPSPIYVQTIIWCGWNVDLVANISQIFFFLIIIILFPSSAFWHCANIVYSVHEKILLCWKLFRKFWQYFCTKHFFEKILLIYSILICQCQ